MCCCYVLSGIAWHDGGTSLMYYEKDFFIFIVAVIDVSHAIPDGRR